MRNITSLGVQATGDFYSSDRLGWTPSVATSAGGLGASGGYQVGVKLRDLKDTPQIWTEKTWVATSEPFTMHLAAYFRSLLLDLCGPLLLASNVQCMVNQHASQQGPGGSFPEDSYGEPNMGSYGSGFNKNSFAGQP